MTEGKSTRMFCALNTIQIAGMGSVKPITGQSTEEARKMTDSMDSGKCEK